MYDGWDRFDASEQAAITTQAETFLETLPPGNRSWAIQP